MKHFQRGLVAGAMLPLAFATGCTASTSPEFSPTPAVSTILPSEAPDTAQPRTSDQLSTDTCFAIANLAVALGGEGYPVVDIDSNSSTLGKIIADETDAANIMVAQSITVENESGETEIPADAPSMDALALTRVADAAVQDMRYYFDGKTLIEIASKKAQPKLEMLKKEADQARALAKEVMNSYCPAPEYPDPQSPFGR